MVWPTTWPKANAWTCGRRPVTMWPPRGDLEIQAWTAIGAANAVRPALRSAVHGEPDQGALHNMPEPAGIRPRSPAGRNSNARRGRPPGRRMLCGRRCDRQLTASRMRALHNMREAAGSLTPSGLPSRERHQQRAFYVALTGRALFGSNRRTDRALAIRRFSGSGVRDPLYCASCASSLPTTAQSPMPLFPQYSSHSSAVIFPDLNSAITRTGSNFSASRSK
jgi:hypothetical protein